jgi:hypothetical protein
VIDVGINRLPSADGKTKAVADAIARLIEEGKDPELNRINALDFSSHNSLVWPLTPSASRHHAAPPRGPAPAGSRGHVPVAAIFENPPRVRPPPAYSVILVGDQHRYQARRPGRRSCDHPFWTSGTPGGPNAVAGAGPNWSRKLFVVFKSPLARLAALDSEGGMGP